MIGDRTLFTTADGIERLWEIAAPVLDAEIPLLPYPQDSWGPDEMNRIPEPQGWRLPFERAWRAPPGS